MFMLFLILRPPMHRCYGAGVCYLLIFNSGMECNILSQRCGRLYFPMFLLNVGLFTFMYMASFTGLAISWPSLPIILKFSTDVVWPVLFWCSHMGDGAFKCSLNLSPNVPDDSPYIFFSQSILSHLNQ